MAGIGKMGKITKLAVDQLAGSLEASRKSTGLDSHRAQENVNWLRSTLFADRLARAFLAPGSAKGEGYHSVELEGPEELLQPERYGVNTHPLKLVDPGLADTGQAHIFPLLRDNAMNVHAVLMPISLVKYWLQRVGVFSSFIGWDALKTLPREIPTLVFKGSAHAARACNRILRGVDSIAVAKGKDGETRFVALSAGNARGLLATLDHTGENRERLEAVAEAGEKWGDRILLMFSAGGTRMQRNVVRVWDLAGAREVSLANAGVAAILPPNIEAADATRTGENW